jgi:hypothetical protein
MLSLLLVPTDGETQTPRDSAAIRATALDYAEGWYAGDAERMRRALHTELAKRMVSGTGASSTLHAMNAAQLVDATRGGGGRNAPAAQQRRDIAILDIHGRSASVRLTMDEWVDLMHIVKWEDRWVIINVLWEPTRQEASDRP